jgi:hypothetical protein
MEMKAIFEDYQTYERIVRHECKQISFMRNIENRLAIRFGVSVQLFPQTGICAGETPTNLLRSAAPHPSKSGDWGVCSLLLHLERRKSPLHEATEMRSIKNDNPPSTFA